MECHYGSPVSGPCPGDKRNQYMLAGSCGGARLKQRLNPPDALARDPGRSAVDVLAGCDADQPMVHGLKATVVAFAHIDPPQTTAASAAKAGWQIGKIFVEAF